MEPIRAEKPIYRKWDPLPGIPSTLSLEAVHDDYEHFRILLKGQEPTDSMLRILFDFVLFYRSIDESHFLRTLQNIARIENSSLYMVENSALISWFHEESLNIYQHLDIKHYSILTGTACLDILSAIEPQVEWLNE